MVCPALLALVLSAAIALPARGQKVLVQNGATVQVTNGGGWHLQGAEMKFGEAGAAARLKETAAGRVFGGSLTATRALDSPSSADPAGLGAEITASVDLGEVTVTRGHTAQTAGGNASIERFYDLSPSQNNSGLSATLVHAYAEEERNGIAENDLTVFQSEDGGSSWTNQGYDDRDALANTVTLNGIDSFSRWTLGSESNPIPVELARFEGTRVGNGEGEAVRLTWRTAAEQNNAGFRVQRKPAEADWQTIGFVDSKAEGGTTTAPQTYRFADEALPYAADTLRYRLVQVDADGQTEATDPVAVARGAVERLQLKKTFPNPAQSRVTVRYAVPGDTDAESIRMRLYDVLGRRVRTAATEPEPGRHEHQLSVSDLANGVYVLRLEAGSTIETRRLTVVH
jgi:hypothetical protein